MPANHPWLRNRADAVRVYDAERETLAVAVNADLARRTGLSRHSIGRLIRGQRRLTMQDALMLETMLGVPAAFWAQREMRYRLAQEEREGGGA